MTVSQLIYTARGKNLTGAFEVWSKSSDVTAAEETEILNLMGYMQPADLPYEPTQAELDALFPRKIAFFELSSGRTCLAQSSYIGKVYSDEDSRTGNFLLHAFLLDKGEEILPLPYAGSGIFRRSLTYAEWHDQDPPASLPRVTLPAAQPVTKEEVAAYFTDERFSRLQDLTQALLEAPGKGAKVFLREKYGDLIGWYRALSLCLPQSAQKNLTFCTYFTPVPNVVRMMNPGFDGEVTLRSPGDYDEQLMSFPQLAAQEPYVFDFKGGSFSAGVRPGNYVQTVLPLLRSDPERGVRAAEKIESICRTCSCSADEGALLCDFLEGRMERIGSVETLKHLLELLKSAGEQTLSSAADALCLHMRKTGAWKMSDETLWLYRFLFDYSERADKRELVATYLRTLPSLSAGQAQTPDAYVEKVTQGAPFAWINYLEYIVEDDRLRELLDGGASFYEKYLAYRTLIRFMNDEIGNSESRKRIAIRYMTGLVKQTIAEKRSDRALLLAEAARPLGAQWRGWLLQNALKAPGAEGGAWVASYDPAFLLEIAEKLDEPSFTRFLLPELIGTLGKNGAFIALYAARSAAQPAFYGAVRAETEGSAPEFYDEAELYGLSRLHNVSKDDLTRCYRKFFLAGRDRGVFVQNLRTFLASCAAPARIETALRIYEAWFSSGEERTGSRECRSVLADAAFSLPADDLRAFIAASGAARLEALRASVDGFRTPDVYPMILFGEKVSHVVKRAQSDPERTEKEVLPGVRASLQEGRFYASLSGAPIREAFCRMYLPTLVRLYLLIRQKNDPAPVFDAVFGPFRSIGGFAEQFVLAAEAENEKVFDALTRDTVLYAACAQSEPARALAEAMLDRMGKARRKKFIPDMQASLPERGAAAAYRFLKEYEESHAGFFDKLKRLFRKEGKEEQPSGKSGNTPPPEEKEKKSDGNSGDGK